MKRLIALSALLCCLCGCGVKEEVPAQSSPALSTPPPTNVDISPPPVVEVLPEPDPIDDILKEMTVEEKVGQLFFVRCPGETAVEDLSAYHLGGYILFGQDTKNKTAADLIETIASYQAAAKVPLLIGVDEEGGTVVRVSSNSHLRGSKFASPQRLFAQGGMEAIVQDTAEKDRLLKALGFNVNLAPVADLSTNPGDFIYDRAFGQDAAATSNFISAVTAQMRKDGLGSALKHFPGYGNNVDTHTGVALDTRPIETFQTQDFLPFLAGFASGGNTTSVLVSHNIVESMDAALPASLSPAVHQILREELGFEGVVMTDDLAMDAVKSYAGEGSAAVLAILAGNDLVITTDYPTQIPQVLAAIEHDEIPMETIDTACRRVLIWKHALGLI